MGQGLVLTELAGVTQTARDTEINPLWHLSIDRRHDVTMTKQLTLPVLL